MTDGPVWVTFDIFRHGTRLVVVSRIVEQGMVEPGETSQPLPDMATVREYIVMSVLGWPRIVNGR